jgi:hypothetical protein
VQRDAFCYYAAAVTVAAAASLLVVFMFGSLCTRIASENPGAFDDPLTAELRRSAFPQRFTDRARQVINRASFAHLVLFQALVGHVAALAEICGCGAVAVLVFVIAVQLHFMRSIRVQPLQSVSTP